MYRFAKSSFLGVLLLVGCTGLMPRIGAGSRGANGEPEHELQDLDEEEGVHEDPDAMAAFISGLELESDGGIAQSTPPSVEEAVVEMQEPDQPEPVPVAYENWEQTDEQCMDALARFKVKTRKPDFDTPFVNAPVLLDGPIEGVEIRPRWPRSQQVNAVMDCRLALALVNLAREAKRHGVVEVLFYSTYRPIKVHDGPCVRGKKGRACRAAKKAYKKAEKGKMSQHRRALAIDIRWFVMEDGETIDLLEAYERHPKKPPCKDEPETSAGRFLKDFACALHEARTFNIMLTPNANKDHHNHFHFDITPDAEWYIIR